MVTTTTTLSNDQNSQSTKTTIQDLFSNNVTSLQQWDKEDEGQKAAKEARLVADIRLRNNLDLSYNDVTVMILNKKGNTAIDYGGGETILYSLSIAFLNFD
jgi:hypothetical protein